MIKLHFSIINSRINSGCVAVKPFLTLDIYLKQTLFKVRIATQISFCKKKKRFIIYKEQYTSSFLFISIEIITLEFSIKNKK